MKIFVSNLLKIGISALYVSALLMDKIYGYTQEDHWPSLIYNAFSFCYLVIHYKAASINLVHINLREDTS